MQSWLMKKSKKTVGSGFQHSRNRQPKGGRMATSYITQLRYTWFLSAETTKSQKYIVVINANKGLTAQLDIHFVHSHLAHGSVCFAGEASDVVGQIFDSLLLDLKEILKKHGRYRGVFLSVAFVKKTLGGRYIFRKIKGGLKCKSKSF